MSLVLEGYRSATSPNTGNQPIPTTNDLERKPNSPASIGDTNPTQCADYLKYLAMQHRVSPETPTDAEKTLIGQAPVVGIDKNPTDTQQPRSFNEALANIGETSTGKNIKKNSDSPSRELYADSATLADIERVLTANGHNDFKPLGIGLDAIVLGSKGNALRIQDVTSSPNYTRVVDHPEFIRPISVTDIHTTGGKTIRVEVLPIAPSLNDIHFQRTGQRWGLSDELSKLFAEPHASLIQRGAGFPNDTHIGGAIRPDNVGILPDGKPVIIDSLLFNMKLATKHFGPEIEKYGHTKVTHDYSPESHPPIPHETVQVTKEGQITHISSTQLGIPASDKQTPATAGTVDAKAPTTTEGQPRVTPSATDAPHTNVTNAPRQSSTGTAMNVLGTAQGINEAVRAVQNGDYVRATGYGAQAVANSVDLAGDISRTTGLVGQASKFSAVTSKAGVVGTVIAGATETVLSAKERYDMLGKNATAIDKAKAVNLGATEGITSFGANFITGGLIGDAPKQLMRGGEQVLKENGLYEYTQYLPGQMQVATNALAGLTNEATRLKASEASMPGQLVKAVSENQTYGIEVRMNNAADINYHKIRENIDNLAPPQMVEYGKLNGVYTQVFNAQAQEVTRQELAKTGSSDSFSAQDINETLIANRFAVLQKAGLAPKFDTQIAEGKTEDVQARYDIINRAFQDYKSAHGCDVLTHDEFLANVEERAKSPDALRRQIAKSEQTAVAQRDNRSWWQKTKDGATSMLIDEQATKHGMALAQANSAKEELGRYEKSMNKYEKAVDAEISRGFAEVGIEKPTEEQKREARAKIEERGDEYLIRAGYKSRDNNSEKKPSQLP